MLPVMPGTASEVQVAHVQEARAALARAMRLGEGTEKDIAGAMQIVKPAAEWGLPDAEYELGMCLLEEGWRDEAGAEKWLKSAQAGGSLDAREALKNFLH